jgi:hypothetical protein
MGQNSILNSKKKSVKMIRLIKITKKIIVKTSEDTVNKRNILFLDSLGDSIPRIKIQNKKISAFS